MTKYIRVLSNNKQPLYAIVDDCDYEELSRYIWRLDYDGYPCRSVWTPKGSRKIAMHRQIIESSPGKVIDHVDRNKLNNSRSNLRVCLVRENNRNCAGWEGKSSKYKGVSWNRGRGKWCVYISVDGRNKYLGLYSDEIEAAKKYDEAAAKYHGEFAWRNLPE